jgi:hypothetical protein
VPAEFSISEVHFHRAFPPQDYILKAPEIRTFWQKVYSQPNPVMSSNYHGSPHKICPLVAREQHKRKQEKPK